MALSAQYRLRPTMASIWSKSEWIANLLRLEMNSWYRGAFLQMGLIGVNLVTAVVLGRHQMDGVYPIDADSVGIPVGITLFASLLVAPAFLLIATRRRRISAKVATLGCLLATFVAALFSIGGALYWLDHQHYLISLAYALLLGMVVFFSIT